MTPAEKHRKLYATRFVFKRLGWILAGTGAVVVAYLLRGVLLPLFLAFLLAYALDPMVSWLQRRKVPRSAAAIAVMVGLLALGTAFLVFVLPYFYEEITQAAKDVPDQLASLVARTEEAFKIRLPHSWNEIQKSYGTAIKERAPAVFQGVVPALFGTLNFVVVAGGLLIIPLFAVYLLTDFDLIVRRAEVLIPRRWIKNANGVAREVHETLGNYVRGQVLACLLLAALYAVGLRVVGVRLAIPIGMLTGLLAFVPYVGFSIGLFLAVVMALLDWTGIGQLVGVLVVMFGVQIVDGVFVTPKIVGGSVGLRPIEVLLTMMAAGTLFGFLGVLLAVPLGAVVKIMVVRAMDAYLGSQFYKHVPAPTTPTPYPLATPLPDTGRSPTSLPPPSSAPPSMPPSELP